MLKWMTGFFLSDHTAAMQKDIKERYRVNEQKREMGGEEIEHVLNKARVKNLPVAIQLNNLNTELQYYDDIIGMVKGFDELGIYIDNKNVLYDEIRNVELYDWHKWSDLK